MSVLQNIYSSVQQAQYVSGDSDLFGWTVNLWKTVFQYSGIACQNTAAKYPEHSLSLLIFPSPAGPLCKGRANGPFSKTLNN